MPIKEIGTLADLLTHLKADVNPSLGPIWFRGHSDFSWELSSTFDRLKKPPAEIYLLNKFRQNANLLLTTQIPKNDFDWLFLMQHYGVPTRLLDWTESPLVALFFAIEVENKKTIKKDGALWLLYPYLLNNNSTTNEKDYIPAFEEEDYLGSYTIEKYSKGKDKGIQSIAAIATRNNPRIQAQLGTFTISHREKKSIEEIGDKKHVVKYKIPSNAKVALHAELELLGLNKFQLFPELSSIGEIIKKELK